MTATDRIFMGRHHAAFQQMADPEAAKRAAIRVSVACGISMTACAEHFGVSWKTVCRVVNGQQRALESLAQARINKGKAERTLWMWQGRERAAEERLKSYPKVERKANV